MEKHCQKIDKFLLILFHYEKTSFKIIRKIIKLGIFSPIVAYFSSLVNYPLHKSQDKSPSKPIAKIRMEKYSSLYRVRFSNTP